MTKQYLAGASAAAVLLVLANVSYAADAVIGEPVPEAPVASSFDWTGAYIGLNAGGGFGRFDHPFSVMAPTTTPATQLLGGSLDISAGGFIGGVQAGYNWQSGQFVYGVETDFQGSTVKAEDRLSLNFGGPGGIDVNGKAGTKVDWFGTLRARLGYAATDRFMVYGTGGLAYGHIKSYINGDISNGGAVVGSIDESKSKTKAGWTIGAGAEYAITNNWTLKSEYLYTDFGKTTLYRGDIFGAGVDASLKNDVAFHTVRIGVNYKF